MNAPRECKWLWLLWEKAKGQFVIRRFSWIASASGSGGLSGRTITVCVVLWRGWRAAALGWNKWGVEAGADSVAAAAAGGWQMSLNSSLSRAAARPGARSLELDALQTHRKLCNIGRAQTVSVRAEPRPEGRKMHRLSAGPRGVQSRAGGTL